MLAGCGRERSDLLITLLERIPLLIRVSLRHLEEAGLDVLLLRHREEARLGVLLLRHREEAGLELLLR